VKLSRQNSVGGRKSGVVMWERRWEEEKLLEGGEGKSKWVSAGQKKILIRSHDP
jgi:hypothetical protein